MARGLPGTWRVGLTSSALRGAAWSPHPKVVRLETLELGLTSAMDSPPRPTCASRLSSLSPDEGPQKRSRHRLGVV